MSFTKASMAAMLAVSMASAPVMAQTAPSAAPVERSGAALDDANQVRGGFIIPLLAVIAVILGILAAVGGGDDDPVSP